VCARPDPGYIWRTVQQSFGKAEAHDGSERQDRQGI
jgi:hypothetical protein